MTALLYILAFIGAWTVLAIIGGFVFGVFFRGASAEDRLAVDIPAPDVDVRERLEPFTNVRRHDHDRAGCDACTGRDRGSF